LPTARGGAAAIELVFVISRKALHPGVSFVVLPRGTTPFASTPRP
jgi:hypothetical protein